MICYLRTSQALSEWLLRLPDLSRFIANPCLRGVRIAAFCSTTYSRGIPLSVLFELRDSIQRVFVVCCLSVCLSLVVLHRQSPPLLSLESSASRFYFLLSNMRTSYTSSLLAALGLFTSAVSAADTAAWKSRNIYFALTDRVARSSGDTGGNACGDLSTYCGGTFQGLQSKLDYIQGMGFDAIWITPVVASKRALL